MDNRVVFHEDQAPIPALKPRGAEHALVKMGLGTNSRDARMVLFVLAVVALAAAFYFISKAVPPTPKLGPDIPQKGEVIPKNRTI